MGGNQLMFLSHIDVSLSLFLPLLFSLKSVIKKYILNSNKKNKVPRNKPNQGGKRPVCRKLYNTEERN